MISFEPTYSWTIIPPSPIHGGTGIPSASLVFSWMERVSKTDGKLKDLFNLVAWNALDGMYDWASGDEGSTQPTDTGIAVDGIRYRCGLYKIFRRENNTTQIYRHRGIENGIKGDWEEWVVTQFYLYTGVPSSAWELDGEDNKSKWIVILPSMETIEWLNKINEQYSIVK